MRDSIRASDWAELMAAVVSHSRVTQWDGQSSSQMRRQMRTISFVLAQTFPCWSDCVCVRVCVCEGARESEGVVNKLSVTRSLATKAKWKPMLFVKQWDCIQCAVDERIGDAAPSDLTREEEKFLNRQIDSDYLGILSSAATGKVGAGCLSWPLNIDHIFQYYGLITKSQWQPTLAEVQFKASRFSPPSNTSWVGYQHKFHFIQLNKSCQILFITAVFIKKRSVLFLVSLFSLIFFSKPKPLIFQWGRLKV